MKLKKYFIKQDILPILKSCYHIVGEDGSMGERDLRELGKLIKAIDKEKEIIFVSDDED